MVTSEGLPVPPSPQPKGLLAAAATVISYVSTTTLNFDDHQLATVYSNRLDNIVHRSFGYAYSEAGNSKAIAAADYFSKFEVSYHK